MTMAASPTDRAVALASELDSQLVRLRRSLSDVRSGDGAAAAEQRQARQRAQRAALQAAGAVDQLARLEPPLTSVLPATAEHLARAATPTRSSEHARALTDTLWTSLAQLKQTLEPDAQGSTEPKLEPRLEPRREPEPEPEPEPRPPSEAELSPASGSAPYEWEDTVEATICRAVAESSAVLRPAIITALHAYLPPLQRVGDWTRLFSCATDGSSLATLLRRCADKGPTVLAVRDTRGNTFGGFAATPWAVDGGGKFYGNGESFLWAVWHPKGAEPEVLKFGWVGGSAPARPLHSSAEGLGMGGGGTFGLWLDAALAKGTSGQCETFGNPGPLSSPDKPTERGSESFVIRECEVWLLGT